MANKVKIEQNVMDFLHSASNMYGRMNAEFFSQDSFAEFCDQEIFSPIEQLFYIACKVLCASQLVALGPDPYYTKNGEEVIGIGVFISPQKKIGKYRVDFLITQNKIGPNEILTPVVVELDGHDFHDKNKIQRAYEKSRDRFLVKAGYRVLHFTGSEVVSDPFKVAREALEVLGVFSWSDDEYNPQDPLGMGW